MIQNLMWRFRNSRFNNPLFIAAALFGLIIIIVLIAFAITISLRIANQDEVYDDPLSGETVYNPKDRTAEKFNAGDQVTYLGFSELLDSGISFSDIQSLKEIIKNIPEVADEVKQVKEVSVDVKSIKHTVTDTEHLYTFGMRFNRETDYKGAISIQKSNQFFNFSLQTTDGSVIYDTAESH